MEFGVRWGQNLSLFSALWGIFEPLNRHRKIVGFDTFSGFIGITEQDGDKNKCTDGSFAVPDQYVEYLERILDLQEKLNPMGHIKRFELVVGDALETIPTYFEKHPETIVSLAILDFDIYKPNKIVLECIKSRLPKGRIIVFDELCGDIFPGETLAVEEILGINNLKIQRMPMTARVSYTVIE